jgi:hypothetical protein
MHVHIYEARTHNQTPGVKPLTITIRLSLQATANLSDPPLYDENIRNLIPPISWIDDATARDKQRTHSTASLHARPLIARSQQSAACFKPAVSQPSSPAKRSECHPVLD